MTIKTINIISFGGLKNFKIDFSKNTNIILGKNGSGKSTLMNFIKLMFYGKTENDRSSDISKNIRKRTKPIDGSVQCGSITFFHNNCEYVIEKNFGLTTNSDEVKITNITTGENVQLGLTEPGKYFTGLSLPQFEHCCYILSNDFTKLETEISDIKEFSPNQNSSENLNSNAIFTKLSKFKENYISKSKKKGLIIEKEQELNNLFFEISNALENEKKAAQLDIELKDTKEKIDLLKKELSKKDDLDEKSSKLKVLKKLYQIKKSILDIDEELFFFNSNKSLNEFISLGDILLQNTLSRKRLKKDLEFSEDLTNLEKLKSICESAKNSNSIIEKERNNVSEYLSFNEIRSKILKEKTMLSIFAPLTIFSLIALFFNFYVFIALFIVLGGFTLKSLISIITLNKNIPQNLEKEIENSERIIVEETEKIDKIFKDLKVTSLDQLYQHYYKLEARANTDSERLNSALTDSVNKFIEHISLFKNTNDYDEAVKIFNELKDMHLNRNNKEFEYKNFLELTENEDYELAHLENMILSLENTLYENEDIYNSNKYDIEKKISVLSDELLNITSRYPKEFESIFDLNIKEEKTKSELNELNKTYSAILLAEEILKESVYELSNDFLPKINNLATKYINNLENNQENNLIVTENVIPQIKKDLAGPFLSSSYLSKGEKNRVYLALRLAIIESIENDSLTKLPVFADDIFVNYDNDSKKRAIDLILDFSTNRQLLFFTCHDEVYDMFSLNNSVNKIII